MDLKAKHSKVSVVYMYHLNILFRLHDGSYSAAFLLLYILFILLLYLLLEMWQNMQKKISDIPQKVRHVVSLDNPSVNNHFLNTETTNSKR